MKKDAAKSKPNRKANPEDATKPKRDPDFKFGLFSQDPTVSMKSKPISKTIKKVVSKQIKKSVGTNKERLAEEETSDSSV